MVINEHTDVRCERIQHATFCAWCVHVNLGVTLCVHLVLVGVGMCWWEGHKLGGEACIGGRIGSYFVSSLGAVEGIDLPYFHDNLRVVTVSSQKITGPNPIPFELGLDARVCGCEGVKV